LQRKKTFLVVCFSILINSLWAQTAPVTVLKNSGLELPAPAVRTVTLLHPVRILDAWDRRTWIAANIRRGYLFLLPDNIMRDLNRDGRHYADPIGFFCKEELQIEKTTHLPIRLRLGSLAENNRLEGKPGW
jgi:hypothetical protein